MTLIYTDSLKDARNIASTYAAINYNTEVNVNHGTCSLFIVAVWK